MFFQEDDEPKSSPDDDSGKENDAKEGDKSPSDNESSEKNGANHDDHGHDAPEHEHLLGADKMVAELKDMLDKFDKWADKQGLDTGSAPHDSDEFDHSLDKSLLMGDGSSLRGDANFRLEGTQYMDLYFFASREGLRVTSTTGGSHNIGSKHYLGRAIDVSTRGLSDEEISRFIELARSNGIRVLDERVRPSGQKVWDHPHLHLDVPARSGSDRGYQNSYTPDRVSDVTSGRARDADWSDGGRRNRLSEGSSGIRVKPLP